MGGGVRSYDGYFMYLYFTIEQLTFPQKVKLVNVPCRPNKVDIVELTYYTWRFTAIFIYRR